MYHSDARTLLFRDASDAELSKCRICELGMYKLPRLCCEVSLFFQHVPAFIGCAWHCMAHILQMKSRIHSPETTPTCGLFMYVYVLCLESPSLFAQSSFGKNLHQVEGIKDTLSPFRWCNMISFSSIALGCPITCNGR